MINARASDGYARAAADAATAKAQQAAGAETAARNTGSSTNLGTLTGTTVTLPLGITPRVGGKLALSAALSGTGTAGQLVTALLRVNGVTFRTMVAEVGATADAWNISFPTVFDDNGGAGFPANVAVAVSVEATAVAALTVLANQAMISAQEVPR